MNNNLRLHELGRGLCECKYIKKGNTAKTTLMHNAIKFLLMINRPDQSEVPRIELCIKKARICIISELFLLRGVQGLFIVPEQPICCCNAGWHICAVIQTFAKRIQKSPRGWSNSIRRSS